jgi:hypothetical protein
VANRAFGGGHGDHHDHHHVKDVVNSKNTTFKQPSQHDIEY